MTRRTSKVLIARELSWKQTSSDAVCTNVAADTRWWCAHHGLVIAPAPLLELDQFAPDANLLVVAITRDQPRE